MLAQLLLESVLLPQTRLKRGSLGLQVGHLRLEFGDLSLKRLDLLVSLVHEVPLRLETGLERLILVPVLLELLPLGDGRRRLLLKRVNLLLILEQLQGVLSVLLLDLLAHLLEVLLLGALGPTRSENTAGGFLQAESGQ